MGTMTNRRHVLVRALAAMICLATLAVVTATQAEEAPKPVEAVKPVPAYTGPTSKPIDWVAIDKAWKDQQLVQFYAEMARQEQERAEQAKIDAARRSRGSPAPPGAPVEQSGDRFDRLAMCESGGDPTSVSSTGKYRGAFQFSLATWHSAGMSGDPIDYSYGDQKTTAMSWATQADPFGQWPVCWARTL